VGGRHAYDGLYMGPWVQSREEMHSYLQCSTKLTSSVSLHASLNRKKEHMGIITSMPHPPTFISLHSKKKNLYCDFHDRTQYESLRQSNKSSSH
jgi:hypothetical protein